METLRAQGRFEEFVDRALNEADEQPDHPALQLARTEALLAVGDNASAESAAVRAATLATDADDAALATQALKLWVVARLRQPEPLASSEVAALLERLPRDDESAQMIRFWVEALGNRQPYEIDEESRKPTQVPPTRAADGTIWADLNAVEARAAGVSLPMVFIDTGTQHTIITRRAAQSAGIVSGTGDTELVGFADMKARPAVLDELTLGSLVIRNVPVLVSDSPALLSAKGQMALGTELMHHVRFTLDYPARRVLAQPAARPSTLARAEPACEIPLWTFPQACLARGDLAGGGAARVLVDTGNRSGTFVSANWARRHMPEFKHPTSTLVFKFKHQNLSLDTMELGSATLRDWPVWDRLPVELERMDVVDVLVGRDLLWPYRVTIDVARRVLLLDGGPKLPVPPDDRTP